MGLGPLEATKTFENPTPGLYLAVCYIIADMGTQVETILGEEQVQHKVHFGWELVEHINDEDEPKASVLMSDGRPFVVSDKYTYSAGDKAKLRKLLGEWRGKSYKDDEFGFNAPGYNLPQYLGKMALIRFEESVSRAGKIWPKITSVTKPMPGTKPVAPKNPLTWFNFDEFDQAVFDSLPKFLRERIQVTQEYLTATQGAHAVTQRAMNQLQEAYPQADLTPKTKSLWADEEAGAVIIPDEPVPF